MVFSSALFLFVFFPVVLGGYFLLHERYRNAWLLLASLFFYSWGEPRYIVLMLFSILSNYCLALLIERTARPRLRKAELICAVLINLGLLAFFKYANFGIQTLNRFLPHDIPLADIALPIGISFYTFQALSYVIDVYRKDVAAQRNVLHLGLYVSFFPQLIAGPIVRYSDIEQQIRERVIGREDVYVGLCRFMRGFTKKVLIADQLAPLVDAIFAGSGFSMPTAWLGAIAFALQIYFDFSGYSDMAIGLGRLFGFRFLENFDHPYVSASVKEFWRRWHISLSSWFRDYVYIPLGGSRCASQWRNYANLIVVFFLTGLWHGASWNFVAWGLFYVVFLIAERAFLGRWLQKLPRAVGHIYTLLVILVGWVFFRADGLRNALVYLSHMFTVGPDSIKQLILVCDSQSLFCVAVGCLFSLPVREKLLSRLEKRGLAWIADLLTVGLFAVAISFLWGKGFSPFLYFRF